MKKTYTTQTDYQNQQSLTQVQSAKQIRSRLENAASKSVVASCLVTTNIDSTERLTVPVGSKLVLDLGGYTVDLSFVCQGELELRNGVVRSPITYTSGSITCRNIDFSDASSVVVGDVSDSFFHDCKYPAVFNDHANSITRCDITGHHGDLDSRIEFGNLFSSTVRLSGGIDGYAPVSSLVEIDGYWFNDASLGSESNILARNVSIIPSIPSITSDGYAVLGRTGATSGTPVSIAANVGEVLIRDASTGLDFRQLTTSDISGLPTVLASNNRINYSHKTADYSVQYEDTGTIFTNYGASSRVNFTLPAATSDGYVFSFAVDGYSGIRINKAASNIIFINGQIIDDTNPGYWESYTPGDYVELTAWDGYTWNGIRASGVFLNSIGNTHLRDSSGLSVIGRSTNSTGDPADIIAASDGYVLRRSGTTLGFGEVAQSAVSGLTASLAAKVTGAGSSTDNAIARFDGTTGSLIQNSTVLISDTGELSGFRQATVSYTSNQTLTAAQSGTRFDNKGSTGTVILTLPTPAAGLHYWFMADTNNTFRVQVGITATHYLMIDGYVSVGYFETSQSGDGLYIYASDTLGWQGFSNTTLAGNRGDVTVGNYQRTWTINTDAVTFAKMQNSAAGLSVVGRPTNSAGDFSEIVAATDGYYLRRNGTALEFGPLPPSVTDHTLLSNIGTLTHAQLETSLNNKADISDLDGYQTKYSAAGLSVLGKPTAGAGVFSEIVAANDGYVLKYISGEIKFAEHNSGVTDHTLLTNIGTNSHATIDSHLASTSNPHNVTKSQILAGNLIVNSDISVGADIALTKLDTVTPSMALVSDVDGYITAHGTVSATELGYLDGVTSAIQTQINGKEPTIAAGTTSQYWRGDKSWQTLDKSAVGLGNVDNTSDANKPISTATQTALDLKADKAALDGYVLKAASSTDNALIRFDGTSGRNIQNSSVLISDSDEITGLRRKVSAKTADYTVLTSDSDTLFTNRGATSQITFTLPTVQSGLIYHFISYESQGIKIKASSGNALSFRNETTTLYVDGYLLLGAANDAITLVGQDDGYMYLGVDFVAADSNSDAVSSVFGRTGAVVAATNDYTWAQINKATSSIADITTRNHSDLSGVGTNTHAQIDTHIANTSNPHSVTKSQILTGNLIVNADISVGADIALTKLDTVTPSMALVSDVDGYITAHSTVSATELGYLDGVTSAVQTQLNNKVNIVTLDGYLVNTTIANSVLGRAGNTSGIVAPIQATVSGTYLGYNGTDLVWSTPSGAGDVTGPSSATDNALTRFDGTTGKIIQNSSVTLSDTGYISGMASITGKLNTDFYITTDGTGTHKFYNNAIKRWEINNVGSLVGDDVTYSIAPRILGGSNSSSDVIYSCVADPDTGIGFGGGSTNSIKFITGGANPFEITENAIIGHDGYTYTPMIIGGTNSSITPLFTSFDDQNTGLGFGNDDTLKVITGSTNTFTFNSDSIIGNSLQSYIPQISMGVNALTNPIYSALNDPKSGFNIDGYLIYTVSNNANDFKIGNSKIEGVQTGGAVTATVRISESTDGSSATYGWTQDSGASGLAFDTVPFFITNSTLVATFNSSGLYFDRPQRFPIGTSTSTSSINVDASLYQMFYWTASFGAGALTLSVDNLAAGNSVKVFCKNSAGATEPALTVQASSTTSGHVSVTFMLDNGSANASTGWSLPAGTWTCFEIFNINTNFVGRQD